MRVEVIYSADKVFTDYYNPRMSTADIREFQDAFNVNLSDDCDDWFDQELPNEISPQEEISEEEFFNRYVF